MDFKQIILVILVQICFSEENIERTSNSLKSDLVKFSNIRNKNSNSNSTFSIIDQHILIRRSNPPKRSKFITELKNKELSTSSSSSSSSHLEIPIIIEQDYGNFFSGLRYEDLINPPKDFTEPIHYKSIYGYELSLLDIAINEIIYSVMRRNYSSIEKYVYIDMFLISPYLNDPNKKLTRLNPIYAIPFKNKIIIMVDQRKNNHACVLIADTETKLIQYYNPVARNFSIDSVSNLIADVMLKNFLKILRAVNIKVSIDKRVNMEGWSIIPPTTKLPPLATPRVPDFGIHAIQFIDYVLNNGVLTFKLSDMNNIEEYKTEIRNAIFRRWWNNHYGGNIIKNPKYPNYAPINKNGLPCFEDLINLNKDFTAPIDVEPPHGKKVCLLDYSIKEIIIPKKTISWRFGNIYVPLNMHMITPYAVKVAKITQKSSIVDLRLRPKAEGRYYTVIIPIYRPGKHAVVMMADMRNKIIQYYNPVDPNLETNEAKQESVKMMKYLLIAFDYRNGHVAEHEKIEIDGWNITKPDIQLPPVPGNDNFDFGIHAILFIDLFISSNTQPIAFDYRGNINRYYTRMRTAIIKKMWDEKREQGFDQNCMLTI